MLEQILSLLERASPIGWALEQPKATRYHGQDER